MHAQRFRVSRSEVQYGGKGPKAMRALDQKSQQGTCYVASAREKRLFPSCGVDVWSNPWITQRAENNAWTVFHFQS